MNYQSRKEAKRNKVCATTDCGEPAISKGLCRRCYAIDRSKGPGKAECTIEGCTRNHWAKGMCTMHYQRMRLTGTTDAPIPELRTKGCRRRQKLTWPNVRAIRLDERKQTFIAEAYGVSQATISLILNEKIWTNDPELLK